MLDPKILAEYNEIRQTHNTSIFCHAPFTSINFEQNGNATVCCYNRAHVLGTYPQDSIEEIWRGRKADQLRKVMRRNVLPAGCQICQDQFHSKNFGGLRARFYDQLSEETYPEADGRFLPMPKVMEFETSNVCNLGCTMCNGYFSSTIRKHREHRPPLKSPYDRRFVEQLEPFIPHLTEARFLGGEPFLIKLYHRIWELIAQLNPDIDVTIVTNGTILNDKVKEILASLKARINISIDSLDRENYERIRVNAKFDQVMENFRYFRQYVKNKNTTMTFNVCPMQQNWRELPHFLEFCNEHDILLFFNTVIYPEDMSLRTMTRGELGEVVEYLKATEFSDHTDAHKWNKNNYLDMIHQIESFQAKALDDADLGRFHEEDLTGTEWSLRVDGGNEAGMVVHPNEPEVVRVAIQKAVRNAPWDIQLNRATVPLRSNYRYLVMFRARAARPRPLTLGVARAAPPWDNLGLYTDVNLTSEWQDFQLAFGPTAAPASARIHFDIGDSDAAVELSALRLRSLPMDPPADGPRS